MALIDTGISKLKNISKIPELRERIIFTLLMFLVARIGTHIPAPGIDIDRLAVMTQQSDILGYINMFSGGAFSRVSIFALGIVPYINASIVFSLLGSIIPKLEEMRKEGEGSRNKLTQWTRYTTIGIAILQGIGVCTWLQSSGLVLTPGPMFFLTTITTLTAGTVFLMWVGEQISLKGLGNGVSLLIFLNVISRIPADIVQTVQSMKGSKFLVPLLLIVALAAIAVTTTIVLFQLGQRKIPVHYVGKGFGGKIGMGENSYIPLKLNTAGVMPVIFASVVMMIPQLAVNSLPSNMEIKVLLGRVFQQTHPVYMIMYAIIIIFFSFFYTAIVFDPDKVADNLKQGGGTIPGIRPGEDTAEYLEGVVTRITWGGAIFLAIICILPNLIFGALGLPHFFGGTGMIIVVGVAIDTIQQIDSHMVVKEYKGFI
ncbi:MAG: preprotein translocase subunit SecY [Fusobacteriaceae bacterium]